MRDAYPQLSRPGIMPQRAPLCPIAPLSTRFNDPFPWLSFVVLNSPQEIGRAGRDGRSARCCLLLCDKDFVTHHSLSHSKGLELVQVRRGETRCARPWWRMRSHPLALVSSLDCAFAL